MANATSAHPFHQVLCIDLMFYMNLLMSKQEYVVRSETLVYIIHGVVLRYAYFLALKVAAVNLNDTALTRNAEAAQLLKG